MGEGRVGFPGCHGGRTWLSQREVQRPRPDHDDLLRRIATELLGWAADDVASTWIPSDESDVFEIAIDGRSSRIVKVERPETWCVRREEAAFPVLRAQGFLEFPEIEHATASLDDAPAPFLVMPKARHRPWDALWAEDRRLAVWTVERIGDFLRRLADVDWRTVPGVVGPDVRSVSFVDWFERYFQPLLDGELSERDRSRMVEVLDAMRRPPTAFGGWQFAQALTDGHSVFVAIDWGNLGALWPLHDLAAAICSLHKFATDAPAVLREPLLAAFTGGRPFEDHEQALLDHWLDLWDFFGRAAEIHAAG